MPKILILDDEPDLLNVVYNIVKPLGFPILKAEDGRSAIELGRKEMPDIALLDMRVPDMDGLEVLIELKKINPDIKCIMVSGFADSDTISNATKAGAFSYISKPFKIDEVLSTVKKALAAMPQAVPGAEGPACAKANRPLGAQFKALLKNPIVMGALVILLLVIVAWKLFFSTSKITRYTIAYSHPSAVCFVRPNILVADWVSGSIYEHETAKNFAVLTVNNTLNFQPSGLAYDGEYVWSCSTQEKRIYKHKRDDKLNVERIFALSGEVPDGIFCDGVNLWVLDGTAGRIFKHKLDDQLSLLGHFDNPSVNPCGMFKAGDYYYIGDYKSGKIFKVKTSDLSVSNTYTVSHLKDKGLKLSGLSFDGENVWFSVDERPEIYKLPLSELKELKL